MAPIQELSWEILQKILVETLPLLPANLVQLPYSHRPYSLSDSLFPLNQLCAVCRIWRDVLIKTPRVWSNIVLEDDRAAAVLFDYEFFQERLSRSDTHPLDIHIRPRTSRPIDRVDHDIDEELRFNIASLAVLLSQNMARIRVLLIDCRKNRVGDALASCLFPPTQTTPISMSSLELLQISMDLYTLWPDPATIDAPRLTRLILSNHAFLVEPMLTDASLLRLEQIASRSATDETPLRSVVLSRRLKVVSWHGNDREPPVDELDLPDLLYLHLTGFDAGSLQFLENFSTQSLRTLRLGFASDPQTHVRLHKFPPADGIWDNLVNLKLEQALLNKRSFALIFRGFSRLQNLTLWQCTIEEFMPASGKLPLTHFNVCLNIGMTTFANAALEALLEMKAKSKSTPTLQVNVLPSQNYLVKTMEYLTSRFPGIVRVVKLSEWNTVDPTLSPIPTS
ncbi:hypothetical protein M422DRAFT_30939 [Sphaerobolus stellatus SS14]|uniref:F-box domain-containing protein n=1 Tax=Sphaerobolus stellatus (strain SS14) TaxID=990650 RepID=A0A0C9VXR6_SPHS4|nr:hypothetical protein M422DRAFT_30939 [Sphaerobolus stellatus SS14]